MSTALIQLSSNLAQKFGMTDTTGVMETLKATAFKGQVSDAQMTALLIVAQQYGLNPWTKEIYAFPDKNNGIVPVVGVDGWARIINDNPNFDGMKFEQDDDSCTCIIYRKDRAHPVSVTEFMSECKRNAGPWQSHPKRMLRHKAMIQCSRLAFGYGGIYDQDEAERIVEKEINPAPAPKELPAYTDAQMAENLPKWREAISVGKSNAAKIINMVATRYTLSLDQTRQIQALEFIEAEPEPATNELPLENAGEEFGDNR
jgi:phage recombination protein Bet